MKLDLYEVYNLQTILEWFSQHYPDLSPHSLSDNGRLLKRTFHRALPELITGMRCYNTAGQCKFVMDQAEDYFKVDNPAAMNLLTIITALCSITIILICKQRAIERTFGPQEELILPEPDLTVQSFSPTRKTLYYSLVGCALFSAIFEGMYGYLGATTLNDLWTDKLNETLASILSAIFSSLGLSVSLACYLAYDFLSILKPNAQYIAQNLNLRNLKCDVLLLKAFGLVVPPSLILAFQTIFTTQPTLNTIPKLSQFLGPFMIQLLAKGAGMITFATVMSLTPTVRNYLAESQNDIGSSDPLIPHVDTPKMQCCHYTTCATGAIDSVFNAGLAIFLAVPVSLALLFNCNKDNSGVIFFALVCAFFAIGLNIAATIYPGYKERMTSLAQVSAPTPVRENPSSIYQSARKIGLFFSNTCNRIQDSFCSNSVEELTV